MPANARLRLRLQVGSQYGPLAEVGSHLHTRLCQVLEIELADRLNALGVPGAAEIEVVADETQSMPVRWFVDARECYYSDEIPMVAWAFVRRGVLGSHITSEGEHNWMSCMQSAAVSDARIAEELTTFFRLFMRAVLQQRPSALLGSEQIRALAAQFVRAGLPNDSPDFEECLGSIFRRVLDMGLSIADAPRLLPVLKGGRGRSRAASDLEEDLIAELTPKAVEVHASLAFIKRFSLASAEDEKPLALMRERFFHELGIRYPRFRFVVSDGLPDRAFAFKINAWPTVPWVGLAPDEVLVNDTADRLEYLGIKGLPAINPANGSKCAVINAANRPAAEGAGLTTWDEHGYLILCLSAELRRHSAWFLNVRTVERDLEILEAAFPNLVARAKEKLGLEQIARVLRSLVSEEISIRNLRGILEYALEFDYVRCDSDRLIVLDDRMPTKWEPKEAWLQDSTTLAQFIRIRLQRYITYKQTRGGPGFAVYLLDQEMGELVVSRHIQGTELSELDRNRVLAAIGNGVPSSPSFVQSPALLTTIEARSLLRKITQTRFPGLPVLCYQELSASVEIKPLATITL